MMNDPDMIVDNEPGMEDVDVLAEQGGEVNGGDDTAGDVTTNNMGSSGSNPYGIGPYTVNVTDAQYPYFGQLLAGPVLVISILLSTSSTNNGYGIAAGVIATILSMVGLRLIQLPELHDQQLFALPVIGLCSVGYTLALVLFIWWTIAAGVLTFDGPFDITGNGYFAVWGGFFFSLGGLGITAKHFQETDHFMRLATCCIVIICATPVHFDGEYRGEAQYAMSLACLTLAFTILVLAWGNGTMSSIIPTGHEFTVIAGLAFLWVIEAALATFRGPFEETGNGYFASWGAAVITVLLAAAK